MTSCVDHHASRSAPKGDDCGQHACARRDLEQAEYVTANKPRDDVPVLGAVEEVGDWRVQISRHCGEASSRIATATRVRRHDAVADGVHDATGLICPEQGAGVADREAVCAQSEEVVADAWAAAVGKRAVPVWRRRVCARRTGRAASGLLVAADANNRRQHARGQRERADAVVVVVDEVQRVGRGAVRDGSGQVELRGRAREHGAVVAGDARSRDRRDDAT